MPHSIASSETDTRASKADATSASSPDSSPLSFPASPAPLDSPLALDARLPVRPAPYECSLPSAGLILVDEINGFCQVQGGALSPQADNAQVTRMVALSNDVARCFSAHGRPLLAFIDSHSPGVPEPPYPAHCEQGSGEDELVAELAWLESDPHATLVRKDCINGYIGAIDPASGVNALQEWVGRQRLKTLIVAGICTDICVMDLVLTLLSARNHGLLGEVSDIVVLEPACATYDLSAESVAALGLPAPAIHPQRDAHHIGLYCMASRGAIIASQLRIQA